ncbi:MAG: hypothetical protein PQJ59_08475 [Spirochaetales bacterium]|nr:hypothetical protein [Spirochaetales bacterium]
MKCKKKWLTVLLLLVFVSAGLTAIDIDYHTGVGISIPYVESQAVFAFPSLYGGLGANLTPKLALGIEYEVFGMYLMGYGFFAHLPKAYLKFDMAPSFTLTGVGGVFFPTVFSPDDSETITEANRGFVGARATLFFLYGEYLFLIDDEEPVGLLSLGAAIKR